MMTERKWTPPSWQSGEYHSGYYQALKDSAAGDLYEALDRIVFDWDGEPEDMAEARAALAKARGEQ